MLRATETADGTDTTMTTTTTTTTTTPAGAGYCVRDTAASGATLPPCVPFTNFEVSPAGKLVLFSTAGESVAARLVTPGAAASAAGLTATLTSGDRSSSQGSNLYVLFTLSNDSGATQNITTYEATYQGPDGITLKPTANAGLTSLPTGAKGLYVFVFANANANAKAGGTLSSPMPVPTS